MDHSKVKGFFAVAQEQGSIILPRWFLWMVSTVSVMMVPMSIGAVGWAWAVNQNLTQINVSLQYIRDGADEVEAKVNVLDKELESHLRDPAIHRYELERIRAAMQRLSDRVERLEKDDTSL